MLRETYRSGIAAALARFKLAEGTLGADYGVAPKGEETSHGTLLNPYPMQRGQNPQLGEGYQPGSGAHGNYGTDFLWNLSKYDGQAPGATGEFGQEVIG
jgi:hypothetical protein